jgi:hypothetical protein
MHIAAVCPRCESRYQVDDSLRGKRMRCPNPLCKTIFEVKAEGDQAAPEAPKAAEPPPPEIPPPTVSGSVSDMLEGLSAELAEPAPPAVEKPVEPKRRDKAAAPPAPPVKPTRQPIVAAPIVAAPPQLLAPEPSAPTW